MSFDNLIKKIYEKQNPTVVGLDPKLSYIPPYILDAAEAEFGKTFEAAAFALIEYNKAIIDEIYDIVPAIKPQVAYYEMYGWQGLKVLSETIDYAKSKGMYIITDGKRNDIGATMQAYTTAHLGSTDLFGAKEEAFSGDSLTVNAYLGTDGISPLLSACKDGDKGIFVLVKTSNPSSGELQDKKLENGNTVYKEMAEMCKIWGQDLMGEYGYNAVGTVVGATYPEQLLEMRQNCPNTFFLVPGYGAQGGGADEVMPAFDKNGLGAIINSSRGIICAWQDEKCDERDFAKAARRAALKMKDDLMSKLGKISI